MSANSRRMQKGISPTLRAHGFAGSGSTWRRALPDVVSLVNLQGSSYGPSYFVNLGVYLRGFGESQSPREVDCHIRTRLGQLVPDGRRLDDLLDLETVIDDSERFDELSALMVRHGLPWLDRLRSLKGARAWYADPQRDPALVRGEAVEILDPRRALAAPLGWLEPHDGNAFQPRQVEVLRQAACGQRSDYLWVQPDRLRGLGAPILLAPRQEGVSLAAPLIEPVEVYVCAVSDSPLEPVGVLAPDDVTIRHWGVLRPIEA